MPNSYDDLKDLKLNGASPETERVFASALGQMRGHRVNQIAYKRMTERGDFKNLPEGVGILIIDGVLRKTSESHSELCDAMGDELGMMVVPHPKKFPKEERSQKEVLEDWVWARWFAFLRFMRL